MTLNDISRRYKIFEIKQWLIFLVKTHKTEIEQKIHLQIFKKVQLKWKIKYYLYKFSKKYNLLAKLKKLFKPLSKSSLHSLPLHRYSKENYHKKYITHC